MVWETGSVDSAILSGVLDSPKCTKAGGNMQVDKNCVQCDYISQSQSLQFAGVKLKVTLRGY